MVVAFLMREVVDENLDYVDDDFRFTNSGEVSAFSFIAIVIAISFGGWWY